jgi:hypothetical protein
MVSFCYVMKWSIPRHSVSLLCHEMVKPQTVSVCFVMKWSSPRHSISLFCHEMVKPQIQYQSVLSWNGQAPEIVYVLGLTISRQNRLILYLGLDHFMTKHTDTMSGSWPFHDKTDRYYIWGLTISWQHRLILYLRLDHFMTKQTDTMSGAWPSVYFVMKYSNLRHIISLFWHEMVKPQT